MEKKSQVEYQLKLDGMRCPMCEEHVNHVVRQVKGVHKANASYRKNRVCIVMDGDTEREAIIHAITSQGYRVLEQEEKPYTKKSLFSFLHFSHK